MMKRLATMFLAMILVGTTFAGCNTSGSTGSESSEPSMSSQASASSEESSKVESSEPTATGMTIEDIKAKGKLIMGLDDSFAPMGFREADGTLVGFDIDLANAVGEKLGVEVEFQPISWDAKEMELNTKNIDCIWNGMSVTPSREAEMSLSKPYLSNRIVVMTNEGAEIARPEELADKNIGIQAGSAALEAVKSDAIYESIKDKIVEYPTYDEVILDMKTGRLDCMVIDEVFGEYKNTKLGGIYTTVGGFDFGADLYAIGFRKEDVELTNSVDNAIKELVAEGKTAEISEKWFGTNIVLG